MRQLFQCTYKTSSDCKKAAAAWMQQSIQTGIPLNKQPDISLQIQRTEDQELFTTLFGSELVGWKFEYTGNNQPDELYTLLFDTVVSEPGKVGQPARSLLTTLLRSEARSSLGFAMRFFEIGKGERETLACYASDKYLYLFDPKTGLWQMTREEPNNFATHMQKHYGKKGTLDVYSWVIPDCTMAARSIAADTSSDLYEKMCLLQCWDAVAYCSLLSGMIDEARYQQVSNQSNPNRQTRDHHILVTKQDPQVRTRDEMTRVPQNHAVCFFRKRPSELSWVMIHSTLSLGGGKAAGTKNACLRKADGKTIGSIGWEILDLLELNWQDGKDSLTQDTDEIYVHHRPIAKLAN